MATDAFTNAESWLAELLAGVVQHDTRSRREKEAAVRAAIAGAYPDLASDEANVALMVTLLLDRQGPAIESSTTSYGILAPVVERVHQAATTWGMALDAAPPFGTVDITGRGEATAASFPGPDGTPMIVFDAGLIRYAYGIATALADHDDGGTLASMAWLSDHTDRPFTEEVLGVLIAYIVMGDPSLQRLPDDPRGRPYLVFDVTDAIETFVAAHEYAHAIAASSSTDIEHLGSVERELWCDRTAAQLQMVVQQRRGVAHVDTYIASYMGLRCAMLVEVARAPWRGDQASSHPGRQQRIESLASFLPDLASGGGMSHEVTMAIGALDTAFDSLNTRVWQHMAMLALSGVGAPDPGWQAKYGSGQ